MYVNPQNVVADHRTRKKLTRPRTFRFELLEPRAMLSVNGDFNRDGYDDLAVGAPGEDVGIDSAEIDKAGAVSIIYGSRKGLRPANNQFWHLSSPGVNGVAESGDGFGYALGIGDFNGDGYS